MFIKSAYSAPHGLPKLPHLIALQSCVEACHDSRLETGKDSLRMDADDAVIQLPSAFRLPTALAPPCLIWDNVHDCGTEKICIEC